MRRLQYLMLAVVLIGGVQNPAIGRQNYASYVGPDAIKIGQGGTKVDAKGIEFWTSGAPARPFKVVGIFTDSRKDRWWDGDAIGSSSIAKKVRAVGGVAVILLNSDTKIAGIASFSSSSGSINGWYGGGGFGGTTSSSGFASSEVISRVTTRLLVVRYLTADEMAGLEKNKNSLTPSNTDVLPPIFRPISETAAPAAEKPIGPPSKNQIRLLPGCSARIFWDGVFRSTSFDQLYAGVL